MTTDAARSASNSLKKTPLHDLHVELGGKMVPFAGYDMPVQFPMGVMREHMHTREKAGLFDVSHMGQLGLAGESGIAEFLETLVPANIRGLKPGRMRYTQFTTEAGGIIDDLMVTRLEDWDGEERFFLVVNGARKEIDFAHLRTHLPSSLSMTVFDPRGLLALQGPRAADCLGKIVPECRMLGFMQMIKSDHPTYGELWISRSGYTGEDGFEISVAAEKASELARALLDMADVEAIGLGARDSLRLEAGLCLYGHDLDETVTPAEADLVWSIGKARRETGGFPGDDVILEQIKNGVLQKRVGILPDGRAPAREGVEICNEQGKKIGEVTSGGYGPTVGGPVAMGYVEAASAVPGRKVQLKVRGKLLGAQVTRMPFVPHRYRR